MNIDVSRCSATVVPFRPSIGAVKLGHPQPLSNFSPERKSGSPQQMQRYVPGVFVFQYLPVKARSVPFLRAT